MMTEKERFIKYLLNSFQNNKGISSFYCFNKHIIAEIVYRFIVPYNKKNTNENIIIVVDGYKTRKSIIDYLNSNGLDYKDLHINILSADYIGARYHYYYDFIITIGVDDDKVIYHLYKDKKRFMLSILTNIVLQQDKILFIRQILNNIDVTKYSNIAYKSNNFFPVEEHRIAIELDNDTRKKYDQYTEYINTSVNIFGNINNIEKCKVGDKTLNITAATYRENLAKDNGWNSNLNTTIEFQKRIDDVYNPNSLYERACNFYNIAKERRNLISDYKDKIKIIADICNENKDKKILIVSKRGEFAELITQTLLNTYGILCGSYHDNIESTSIIDNNGECICYKSGVNRGKPKIFGSQAISSFNMNAFNNGDINILSIKNSSNTKLKIACHIIIFTSSLYSDYDEFKSRFNHVDLVANPNKIFKIYCSDTMENVKIKNTIIKRNVQVIYDNENNVEYNENLGNIVL